MHFSYWSLIFVLDFVILQAGTQFKTSLNNLMTILMCKQPSYVRCIKPNDSKKAGQDSWSQLENIITSESLDLGKQARGSRRNNACFLVHFEVKSRFKYIPVGLFRILVMLPQFNCQVLLQPTCSHTLPPNIQASAIDMNSLLSWF